MALSSLYGPEAHYALMLNISDTGFSIGEELYGTQGQTSTHGCTYMSQYRMLPYQSYEDTCLYPIGQGNGWIKHQNIKPIHMSH